MSGGHRDELHVVRERHRDVTIDEENLPPNPTHGNPSCLVQTVTVATYPTTATAFYMCKRVRPGGVEKEGAAVTLAPYGNPFAVANLGTAIPPSGTYDLATLADGRWILRFDG